MKKLMAIVLISMLLGGFGVRVFAQDTQVYVVQAGDVLWRIALDHGTTWEELADYNNLANPHLIFVGQQIHIPAIPYVTYEIGRFTVRGLGGYISYAPVHNHIYFAGSRFPITQLYGEPIEGSGERDEESLWIRFVVARDFSAYTGIVHGALEGPGVFIQYVPLEGNIVQLGFRPYHISYDRSEYFYLDEENALAFARLLMRALHLIDEYGTNK